MKRIGAALLALAGCYLVSAVPASAQAWPNRPVRIVNTFAPGGAADFLARTVADGMAAAFGQPFFVETHAGAAGQIGIQTVINTPPDGYNFVLTNITMLVFAPITNPKLGYDPQKNLTNIAYIGGSPIVLTVNSKGERKDAGRFHRLGKRRQAVDLFVVRRRQQRAPVRRVAGAAVQHQGRARSVQRRGAGADGSGRRTHCVRGAVADLERGANSRRYAHPGHSDSQRAHGGFSRPSRLSRSSAIRS